VVSSKADRTEDRGARLPLIAAVLGAALGCGDPAHDGSYEGEIIAELHCTYAFTVEGGGPQNAHMHIGLLWLVERDGTVEAHPHHVRDVGTWPTSKLRLDQPPDDDVISVVPEIGRVALGQIVAWSDDDLGRTWTPDEEILALSRMAIVVYAPPPRRGDPPTAFAPGFHMVVPNACDSDAPRLDLEGRHPGCLIEPAPDDAAPFFRYTCPTPTRGARWRPAPP